MQQLGPKPKWRLTRPVALVLAILSLLLLLQVTPHGHKDGHDEAACRICQAAHLGVTPALSGIVLTVPLVPMGEVTALHISGANENFLSHSDPRAPPAEPLS